MALKRQGKPHIQKMRHGRLIVGLFVTCTTQNVGSGPWAQAALATVPGTGRGLLSLRGGAEPHTNRDCGVQALARPAEHDIDGADIRGDVWGEGESEETLGVHAGRIDDTGSASEPSFPEAMSSGVDEDGNRVWGARKATLQQLQQIGSGREAWNGKYWANIEQKRCEIPPPRSRKEKAAGIRPKSILWGDDCPEATMDPPSGYFRPYGDAIPLNDTWIGEFPDGSPALLRDICCGSGDTAYDFS